MPNSADQMLLGSFTYDPSSPSHIQTFPVESAVVDLGIDVGIVIFKIQSNWGGEYTCLYRVSDGVGMADVCRSEYMEKYRHRVTGLALLWNKFTRCHEDARAKRSRCHLCIIDINTCNNDDQHECKLERDLLASAIAFPVAYVSR